MSSITPFLSYDDLIIRPEDEKDWDAVRSLNESAFESMAEANLVDSLRQEARPIISIVAELDGSIVGHIHFSPVTLRGHADLNIMGLAPMAVSPSLQRKGIGSKLVETGLDTCRQHGVGALVVLGHPKYYPRFGFTIATEFGIQSEYDVPAEVFMVTELIPGYLGGASGIVQYHPVFNEI